MRKSKTTWEKGILLCKTYESDEFSRGTPFGVHLVRSVRRLPTEDQADKDIFSTFVGVGPESWPDWPAEEGHRGELGASGP